MFDIQYFYDFLNRAVLMQDFLPTFQQLLNQYDTSKLKNKSQIFYVRINKFWDQSNQNELMYFQIVAQNTTWEDEEAIILYVSNLTEFYKEQQKNFSDRYKTLFLRELNHNIRHPVTLISNVVQQIQNYLNPFLVQDFKVNLTDKNQQDQAPNTIEKDLQNTIKQLAPIPFSILCDKKQKMEKPQKASSEHSACQEQESKESSQNIAGLCSQKIEIIDQEISNLLNMTLNLTQFLSDEKLKIQYDIIQVASLFKEAFKIIKYHIQSKPIELIIIIKSNVPAKLSTDKQKLLYILQIFLTNACKYTSQGYIQLGIKKSKVQYQERDEFVNYKIWVKDSGIGISYEKKKTIFQQLFDRQDINLDDPQGSGMGLQIAQKIAKLLGEEDIQLKSQINKFSKFSFIIKAKNISRVKQELLQTQHQINANIKKKYLKSAKKIYQLGSYDFLLRSPNSIQSYSSFQDTNDVFKNKNNSKCSCSKILLVDDSEIIRAILSEILQNQGYFYEQAGNGKIALDIVIQRMRNACCNEFQVIIMDCEMPVLDGWRATQEIRNLGYSSAIIGYTAYAHEQDVKRCLKAGMNKVLFKPSKSEIILEEIEKFLR